MLPPSCDGIGGGEEYEAMCGLFTLLSTLIPSIEKRKRMMKGINTYISSICKDDASFKWKQRDYDGLVKCIVNHSCVFHMLRKLGLCMRCNKYVKTTSLFCPECEQSGCLSPVWLCCKTRGCLSEVEEYSLPVWSRG